MRPDGPPPGRTELVSGTRVLVLAPHFDDEVIGCGGLLTRLATEGADVRVLFISDGAGDGTYEERKAYSERRQAEAAGATARLGVAGSIILGLPDGNLAAHRDAMMGGIADAIANHKPDLLFCPSPLEVSDDHRAVFRALYDVLSPLRDTDNTVQFTIAQAIRVLLYEVNHPGHPDLLVDVSREMRTVARAMRCYTSQLERHPYAKAAWGLRRFRTLTLSPGVAAAEAYRRLALGDFTTRSYAKMIDYLGGRAETRGVKSGPSVSVILRTRNRPRRLMDAMQSLADGIYRNVEVVLVNDAGDAVDVPHGFPLPLVRVNLPGRRGRAGAAQAGVDAASGDCVAFLDDDDIAFPEHLATLARAWSQSDQPVVYSDAAVSHYARAADDGWECVERRLPYSRDFDPDFLLLDNYIPFNTVLIARRLMKAVGPFDDTLEVFEDWDYLIRLSQVAGFRHLRQVTCEYRHFDDPGHALGANPQNTIDVTREKARILAKHASLINPEQLARAIVRMRAEAVQHQERSRVQAAEIDELRHTARGAPGSNP